MQGTLIAFEGIDGSGKHTQITLLRKAMREKRPKVFHYPDLKGKFRAPIARFLAGKVRLTPAQQFALFAQDIAKDKDRIARLLSEGNTVMLDRFIASTVAYQSAGGLGFSKALVLARSLSLPEPDITILLDLPAKVALARKRRQKSARGRALHAFEKSVAFQEKVRMAFRRLAREGFLSKRWLVVNAALPPNEIHAIIKAHLHKLLE
ncbi:MAG: dTMP kinase [Candidatus Micrarchaeia archaeon]